MKRSSEPGSTPEALILSGHGWDLIMTPNGSAIASGDEDPISLQNLN